MVKRDEIILEYYEPSIGIIGQEVFITVEEFGDTVSWFDRKARLVDYFIKTNEN